jgi:RNA polymerase sigma factor (sigma-70 family)
MVAALLLVYIREGSSGMGTERRADQDQDYAAFVSKASRQLLQLAWLLTGDLSQAEDLVQGALAKVYPLWPRIRDGDPLAYTRRILLNARVDRWRRTRSEWLVSAPPDRVRIETAHGSIEDRDEVRRALRTLSARERRVIVLRYYFDLSLDTLRAALAEPPATPLPEPDPQIMIRLGRRRRRLLRARRTVAAGGAVTLLVVVGPAISSNVIPRLRSGSTSSVTVRPAFEATSRTSPPRQVAPAASSAAAPSTSVLGGQLNSVAPTETPHGVPTSSGRTEPATNTTAPARTLAPTPTLSDASPGSSGFGMPDGGGSQMGTGVAVSPTGSLDTLSAPANQSAGDYSANTFACRAEQFQAQVTIDSATTMRLQQAGPTALTTMAVVESVNGGGYTSVGSRLSGMSVTFGDVRSEGAPTS